MQFFLDPQNNDLDGLDDSRQPKILNGISYQVFLQNKVSNDVRVYIFYTNLSYHNHHNDRRDQLNRWESHHMHCPKSQVHWPNHIKGKFVKLYNYESIRHCFMCFSSFGLRLTLSNRFGLHSNSNGSVQITPPKQNSSTPTTLNKSDLLISLDRLDTRSNGFASRDVKYYKASEAKVQEISNKTYRRLNDFDFTIVNLDHLDKSENWQNLKNAPKVSKSNIAPPNNLVSASARSTIFHTDKNYGNVYPIRSIGKIGTIGGRKPIRTSIAQDESNVPSYSDYDGGLTSLARSSLEALKEIHSNVRHWIFSSIYKIYMISHSVI